MSRATESGRRYGVRAGECGSAAEFVLVHVLLVAGVLAMTWGPLVYLLRTVTMHTTGGF